MSQCIFLVSTQPMTEIKNPHNLCLSINEAIDKGIDLSHIPFLKSIDPNMPNVILHCDYGLIINENGIFDGDADDNFSLKNTINSLDFCDKPYSLTLDWHYFTKDRATKIISYIKDLLKNTDCIEMWNIWLSNEDQPKINTTTISINDLTHNHIENLCNADIFDTKTLPNINNPSAATHYCIKIIK